MLVIEQGMAWPPWALPIHTVPAATLEELVIRAIRLEAVEQNPLPRTETRTSFDACFTLPRGTPVWLHLIRARWLLVQNCNHILELWDVDHPDSGEPVSTFAELEGIVNGIKTASLANDTEVTLSTT